MKIKVRGLGKVMSLLRYMFTFCYTQLVAHTSSCPRKDEEQDDLRPHGGEVRLQLDSGWFRVVFIPRWRTRRQRLQTRLSQEWNVGKIPNETG